MIRRARIEDLDPIMKIIGQGKAYLEEKGIDQWTGDYPSQDLIREDIEKSRAYVYELDGELLGSIVIIIGQDKNYRKIYGQGWKEDLDSYAIVHRLAIKNSSKGQGLGSKLLAHGELRALEAGVHNIRIDTHRENLPMIRLIEKNLYDYRGIIYGQEGGPRQAYEKIL